MYCCHMHQVLLENLPTYSMVHQSSVWSQNQSPLLANWSLKNNSIRPQKHRPRHQCQPPRPGRSLSPLPATQAPPPDQADLSLRCQPPRTRPPDKADLSLRCQPPRPRPPDKADLSLRCQPPRLRPDDKALSVASHPGPTLSNSQTSSSGLEAEEATELKVIANTPSLSESAQQSASNKRHTTKQPSLHENTPKVCETKCTIRSVSSNWEPPSITEFATKDFKTNEREQKAMSSFFHNALSYMLYKASVQETIPEKIGIYFQSFLEASFKPTTEQECSNVVYLDILNEYADNKDTILNTLALLQERLEIGTSVKYIFRSGGRWKNLQSLARSQSGVWRGVIPLPGDWHILKNYQEVMMKVF